MCIRDRYKDDIVNTYAYNLRHKCTYPCAVAGVCAAVEQLGNGIRYREICPDFPLDTCRHFMAVVHCPEPAKDHTARAGTLIEEFYRSRGLMLHGTVADGDCGLDLMCIMLNLPQTLVSRTMLRKELERYLMMHANEPWMWGIMAACQEIDSEDVAVLQSGYIRRTPPHCNIYRTCGLC